MARTLTSPKIKITLSANVVNTLDDGSSASVQQPQLNLAQTLTSGIGASQANRGWQAKNLTIDSGDQAILDLTDFTSHDIGAGNGNDALGLELLLEEIVAIAVMNENAVGDDGQLEVLPSASEGWTPIGSHTVANGGALRGQGILLKAQLAEAGFDVAETNHRITFRAVGGDITYSVYLLGRDDDEESSSSSSSPSSSSSSSVSSSSGSSSSISASSSSISTSSISTSSSSPSSQSSSSSSSISTSSSSPSSQSSSSSSSSSESSSSISSA